MSLCGQLQVLWCCNWRAGSPQHPAYTDWSLEPAEPGLPQHPAYTYWSFEPKCMSLYFSLILFHPVKIILNLDSTICHISVSSTPVSWDLLTMSPISSKSLIKMLNRTGLPPDWHWSINQYSSSMESKQAMNPDNPTTWLRLLYWEL